MDEADDVSKPLSRFLVAENFIKFFTKRHESMANGL